MSEEQDILSRIEALAEPRHLFVVPDCIDPKTLERLIQEGYLTCRHNQRDESGRLTVVMNLALTPKGKRLLQPVSEWSKLALKGSLAVVSLAFISVVILYLG